jgi:acetylornithine deacetylase/succinyl-diaminopimelate desuccinylase-like protein
MDMSDEKKHALNKLAITFKSFVGEIEQFIRIPSITNDSNACEQAARWLEEKLERIGLENIQKFRTIGNPVIYAEKKCGDDHAPTVLVYGHYDVQRPDPLEEWESQPFEVVQKGDYLYGRGTSDMKGQILAVLLAVEAMIQEDTLPLNLKFIFEGNEEAPPQVMEAFVPEFKKLLEADISLNCDAGMLGPDKPTISYGLRGGSVNIIRVTGPARDLHDGMFGGVVENPIHVLCALIDGLHEDDGRITLSGFYDRVRELSAEERSLLDALPVDEKTIAEDAGVAMLWGDPEFTPIERIGARPSLNVRHFNAGAVKSAIPRVAEARLVIRLVPNQDPLEAHQQLTRYVEANTPKTVRSEVEYVVGYPPYLVDRDLPAMRSLSTAYEETWGSKPYFDLVGGGIPVVEVFKQTMGMESLLTGFSLPGDHIHGPNERLHLPTVMRGIPALIRFFQNYGKVSR